MKITFVWASGSTESLGWLAAVATSFENPSGHSRWEIGHIIKTQTEPKGNEHLCFLSPGDIFPGISLHRFPAYKDQTSRVKKEIGVHTHSRYQLCVCTGINYNKRQCAMSSE